MQKWNLKVFFFFNRKKLNLWSFPILEFCWTILCSVYICLVSLCQKKFCHLTTVMCNDIFNQLLWINRILSGVTLFKQIETDLFVEPVSNFAWGFLTFFCFIVYSLIKYGSSNEPCWNCCIENGWHEKLSGDKAVAEKLLLFCGKGFKRSKQLHQIQFQEETVQFIPGESLKLSRRWREIHKEAWGR